MTDSDIPFAPLTPEELAEIAALELSLNPAPWSVSALSAAIRHVQRNTDVMDDAQEYADGPDKSANLPDRYDGDALAKLRNYLPRIVAALPADGAGHCTASITDAGKIPGTPSK